MKTTKPMFALCLALLGTQAHAQFGSGIVFDPTQSVHAISQISQASQRIEQAQQLSILSGHTGGHDGGVGLFAFAIRTM